MEDPNAFGIIFFFMAIVIAWLSGRRPPPPPPPGILPDTEGHMILTIIIEIEV